jgi:hypothetical protein
MRNFMTDRDLIKKLANLKEINPDNSWLKANRDSLYAQISNSGATEPSVWSSFVINFKSILKTASAPAIALSSIMLALIGSSAYSHLLLTSAKPNDSLYIAREISEKAKLTTILNTEEREEMENKFAINNVQDIITVLSDPEFKDQEEIAKLSTKLNEEIKTVKKAVAKNQQTAVQKVDTEEVVNEDVFSATALKDEVGISIAAVPVSETKTEPIGTTSTTSVESLIKEANEVLNQLK